MELPPGSQSDFDAALARLKRRGSNVLIVGRASEETFDDVSADFLGSGSNRARVFGLVGRGVETVRRRLRTAGPGYEPAIVLDAAADGPRSVSAQAASPGSSAVSVRPVERTLPGLETAITGAIADSRRIHGPFDPAEFRLCVDSLRGLGEEHSLEELREFLGTVTRAVVDVHGMGHFVLPGDRRGPLVRGVLPEFEVLIELRQGPDGVEQRWSLLDYMITTPWRKV